MYIVISFRLRFTAVKSLNDGHLADFALDDIALSPACFGRGRFTAACIQCAVLIQIQ